jgi:MOSC domain-containing protein YiiM|tara:strand:- start:43 stop:492 length:450 start_codon:yes stop_codon:yes gene_type:complete
MGKVVEIGITNIKGNQIQKVNKVEALKGKGLQNDRKFSENNQKKRQVTLIEIENINHFNNISNTNIHPVDFRRNIITENVRLNELVGKEFFVGNTKLKGHDLCRPCKYLQEKLKQNNFVKEFLHTGGLRCEILTSGKINVGDIIKQKND